MKNTNWKGLALTCGISAIALGAPGLARASWPAFDLYTLSGYGSHPNQALAINSYAEIVGSAQPGSSVLDFNGYFSGPNLLNQYTTLPNGWTSVQLSGINDSLYMIGTANIGSHPTAVGCQFLGLLVDMTAGLPHADQSLALGVNHNGEVVGSYNQETTKGIAYHTFRWSSVSNTRTQDFTGYLPGGINEAGTIVAANLNPVNYFMQAELDFFPKTGPMTKTLAPGDYMYLYPAGISTYGGITAIGLADLSQENNSGTFLSSWAYNQGTDTWTVLDGPGSPYLQSNALAVDVWGTKIVGSVLSTHQDLIATVWQYVNGQWVANYLSDLLPNQTDWKFSAATGINTYGAISGYGLHLEHDAWVQRAFVATPKTQFGVVTPEGGYYGGLAAFPSIQVAGKNPFAIDFHLTSATLGIQIPRDVTMPGMATSAQFEMDTKGVDSETTAIVTVQLSGLQFTKTIQIHPAILTSLNISPNRDEPGGVGMIGMRGAAGPSGCTIQLSSSDPSVVVPSTVSIPAGFSTGSFRIALGRRAQAGTVVTITAVYGNNTVSQPFTIN